MKEIKDDINRWRALPCSWVGRINIMKMTTLPNKLQIQCNTYHITNGIFTEVEQKISQFMWKHKSPQIAKEVLRKKNGDGGINFPELQIILQSYSHQDSMELAQKQKYRPMEKDSPEINPCICGYLIFDKEGKNIQWAKDNLFNNWCWEN